MINLKYIIAPIHYLRFKYLLSKNLERSRRYFSVLLSLQSGKISSPESTNVSEQELGAVLQKLQRQRQTIELAKRIDQISSAA